MSEFLFGVLWLPALLVFVVPAAAALIVWLMDR